MKALLLILGVCITPNVIGAQTWTPSIPNRAVYSICADPTNPEVLYAGNVSRTCFKSTDGGLVWEERAIGTQGGVSLIQLMAVHPTKPNIVFAGGQGMNGLARSTDGGATWTTVLGTPDGFRFEMGGSGALSFDPAHPDTIYAVRFTYGEIYRSVDAGATFAKLSTLPDIESSDNMRAITVCPDSSNIVIVSGRRAHIYRSTDYGKTWVVAQPLTTYRDTDVANFAWSPSAKGTIYAATQMSLFYNTTNAGLYKSTDYGVTWHNHALVDTAVYALLINETKSGDEIFVGGCQFLFPADNGTIRGDSMVFVSSGSDSTFAQLSDVPWTENETGVVGYNVYGFAVTMRNGVKTLLMASDGGVFASERITSVADASFEHSNKVRSATLVGSSFTVPSWMQGACGYVVYDVCGSIISKGTASSNQSIELAKYGGVSFVMVTNGTDVLRLVTIPGN